MKIVCLHLHGTGLRIESEPGTETVATQLEQELGFDSAAESAPTDVVVRLKASSEEVRPRGRRLFKTRMCTVYGWGHTRFCDYGQSAHVISHNAEKPRRFEVYGPTADLLYELAYVAILSAVGEELDARGLHRVHALGVSCDGTAGLVLLPSGGGKSSIAALLLQKTSTPPIRILSEESPLVDSNGTLYPHPLRLALVPKVAQALGLAAEARVFKRKIYPAKILLPVPPNTVAPSKPASFVLLGRPAQAGRAPKITRCSRFKLFLPLLLHCGIGLGLTQMSEHMLRLNAWCRLVRIAILRGRAILALLRQARFFGIFELSEDPRANTAVVEEFLKPSLKATRGGRAAQE